MRRSIINDTDTQTVLGSSARSYSNGSIRSPSSSGGKRDSLDHGMNCAHCGRGVVGVRYQCASCPATKTQTFNLVSMILMQDTCESNDAALRSAQGASKFRTKSITLSIYSSKSIGLWIGSSSLRIRSCLSCKGLLTRFLFLWPY